jgi:hypothetical protein
MEDLPNIGEKLTKLINNPDLQKYPFAKKKILNQNFLKKFLKNIKLT